MEKLKEIYEKTKIAPGKWLLLDNKDKIKFVELLGCYMC